MVLPLRVYLLARRRMVQILVDPVLHARSFAALVDRNSHVLVRKYVPLRGYILNRNVPAMVVFANIFSCVKLKLGTIVE